MQKTLRLILGDQLNIQHSWFEKNDSNIVYLLMEMRQETDYVKHHIQKVIAFFAAMRSFSQELQAKGHQVIYLKINDDDNLQNLSLNLQHIIEKEAIHHFQYLLPDEYRLDLQLKEFCKTLKITYDYADTEHFLMKREDLKTQFEGKKTYLMETFYRKIRAKYDIMMHGNKPWGDQWNYDHENRNNYDGKIAIPVIKMPSADLSEIRKEIEVAKIKTIGNVDEKDFNWPVNRADAQKLITEFISKALAHFGTYQDAMNTASPWLFHSRLSFAMNIKLIHPLEVVHASIEAFQKKEGSTINLAQLEGFIRQIIGWREYMRGVYWAQMPEYAEKNYFGNKNSLPNWYWDGNTKMNCLKYSINQSLDLAYAHHIQRLMVTGNFALLAGVDPKEVDEWYLGIYIDAIEWVEITNTRGMSQFADGGLVATKPYTSSANYINKMSNYCKTCFYSHNKRIGEKACPFNSLYWNFHITNRTLLGNNPRIGMVYRHIDKMSNIERNEIVEQANYYLTNLNDL